MAINARRRPANSTGVAAPVGSGGTAVVVVAFINPRPRLDRPDTADRGGGPCPEQERSCVRVAGCGRYRRRVPELITPAVHLHQAWLEAHAEWGPGAHEDGFGLGPADEVGTPAGFAAWLTRLSEHRCTYRWIIESDRVLGGIALRHGDDDYVRWAGHLGYGIRPSARGRGLGAWALGRMLDEARGLGLQRVLGDPVRSRPAVLVRALTDPGHPGRRRKGRAATRVPVIQQPTRAVPTATSSYQRVSAPSP
jgi:RimJ/RimL family protein N-acetyltransferase